MRNRFVAVAALVVSEALAPTAPSSSSVFGDFNDADATFATNMIPHHRQAAAMAELADTRAASPRVKDLAAKIMKAQDPEIQTMSDWLTSWSKPVPDDMTDMDMSGSMPGMMRVDDMTSLGSVSGADFDQIFLAMMLEHHRGAIKMAKSEQTDGMPVDVIALADHIVSAPTQEITTIRGLVG